MDEVKEMEIEDIIIHSRLYYPLLFIQYSIYLVILAVISPALVVFLYEKIRRKQNNSAKTQRKEHLLDLTYTLFASKLSPFALKLESILRFHRIPYKWDFQYKSLASIIYYFNRIELIKAGLLPLDIEFNDNYDEFPLVPFLLSNESPGYNFYDSTKIGNMFEKAQYERAKGKSRVYGSNKVGRFIINLIDEFFDEWGLYLVHHKRWKNYCILLSKAKDEDEIEEIKRRSPGYYLALNEVYGRGEFFLERKEELESWDVIIRNHEGMNKVYAALRRLKRTNPVTSILEQIVFPLFGDYFNKRQTRRMAYLFSTCDEIDPLNNYKGTLSIVSPPTSKFPTHKLLDESFDRLLLMLEKIFSKRKSLFNNDDVELFTLAEASLAGQFNMLAIRDREVREYMIEHAPSFVLWLDSVSSGEHFKRDLVGFEDRELVLDHSLGELVKEICSTFVPLMKTNARAYASYSSNGLLSKKKANENGWNNQQSLFTGEIMNHKYVTVVKTFQVLVWENLLKEYRELSSEDIQYLIKGLGFKDDDDIIVKSFSSI